MMKRKFRVLITPVLLLGLAACNNDTDTAMDVQNRDQNNTAFNRNNVDDNYLNQVNYRTNTNEATMKMFLIVKVYLQTIMMIT